MLRKALNSLQLRSSRDRLRYEASVTGRTHLCEGVFYAVIHQNHDEDSNRNTKISNHPAELHQ